MKLRSLLPMLGMVLALTACGTSQPPVKALPPEVTNAVMEAALAKAIADKCRFYRYNAARENQVMFAHAQSLERAGYSQRDVDANMRHMLRSGTTERKAVQMLVSRNIDPSSERSWCAAGKREKARGTNVGRYLV